MANLQVKLVMLSWKYSKLARPVGDVLVVEGAVVVAVLATVRYRVGVDDPICPSGIFVSPIITLK